MHLNHIQTHQSSFGQIISFHQSFRLKDWFNLDSGISFFLLTVSHRAEVTSYNISNLDCAAVEVKQIWVRFLLQKI